MKDVYALHRLLEQNGLDPATVMSGNDNFHLGNYMDLHPDFIKQVQGLQDLRYDEENNPYTEINGSRVYIPLAYD